MEHLYDYKKHAILYVDDEEKSLKYFTRAFEDQFQILTAANAQDGLKLLEAHKDEIGLLTRERDLLPGSYQFGITGRSPTGATLSSGRYELRLVAWPTGRGAPSRARVSFSIQSG